MRKEGRQKQEKALLEMNRILAQNIGKLADAATDEAKEKIQKSQNLLKAREKAFR